MSRPRQRVRNDIILLNIRHTYNKFKKILAKVYSDIRPVYFNLIYYRSTFFFSYVNVFVQSEK